MAVVLNKRNNIKLEIKTPMTSVGTLLVVDKGTLLGEDFANDETKNFSLTLFKLEGDVPVQIEIAEVIAKSGNNLTLRRAVEPCPMNYGAGEMVQQAYDFDVGDVAYMNLTAGDLEDIITELKNTNTRIDTTNTNITNNYVSNAQLQAQKGQPGGIATLDNDGKIPGTQINTQTLEVSALNSEFIAGEDINAGDAVCLTTTGYYYTETITLPEWITGSSSQTYKEQTFTLTDIIEGDYFAVYIAMNASSGQANIRCTITNNGTELYTTTLIGSTTLNEYAVIPCLPGTYTIRFVRSYSYGNVSNPSIHYTKRQAATLKKALFSTADTRNNFIGFAVRGALTGEEIAVGTAGNCPTNNSSLIPYQKCYLSTTTAGAITNINTGYCLGTAVSNNIVKIEKNNKILNITNNGGIFTHNMGSQVILAQINGTTIFPQVNVYDSNLIFINDVFAITISRPILSLKQIYLFE